MTHYVYVNYTNASIPNTFEEAVNSHESDEWKRAIKREIESLNKLETWKLVKRPENKKVIDVKWIFKRKNDNTYKARLVVKGFQQTDCIENNYSPIVKMQTLKLLLVFCCQKEYNIEQMDVETAFLNGPITSEVYVNQPDGHKDGSNKVYKLKTLYGLKESPRVWYEFFNNIMKDLEFERSNHDYCLYVKNDKNVRTYILLFVDDMLICSENANAIAEVKTELKKRLNVKDLGQVTTYIGIDIKYDRKNNKMTLSQRKYIESLAVKYRLDNAKSYKVPMETHLKLLPAKVQNTDLKYRNLIGELLYISMGTRPDISFSVNYMSRFQNCYDKTHYKCCDFYIYCSRTWLYSMQLNTRFF